MAPRSDWVGGTWIWIRTKWHLFFWLTVCACMHACVCVYACWGKKWVLAQRRKRKAQGGGWITFCLGKQSQELKDGEVATRFTGDLLASTELWVALTKGRDNRGNCEWSSENEGRKKVGFVLTYLRSIIVVMKNNYDLREDLTSHHSLWLTFICRFFLNRGVQWWQGDTEPPISGCPWGRQCNSQLQLRGHKLSKPTLVQAGGENSHIAVCTNFKWDWQALRKIKRHIR